MDRQKYADEVFPLIRKVVAKCAELRLRFKCETTWDRDTGVTEQYAPPKKG